MIVFNTVTVKNFLSYGNSPTTWALDKHKSTLIVGRNGHGKSVLLDAVCFGLFGRPFRNINKPQLINSINQKGCVVELAVTVNGEQYNIIRGMKPSIFRVIRDGKELDQEAAMKDMQEFLEQQILKLSFKTFCQVVILGSASYTPFMQLPSHQRREVIEDVLDIGIFSKMNSVLKDRIAGTKEELRVSDIRIESARKESEAQKRIIQLIEKSKNSRIQEIDQEMVSLKESIVSLDESISGLVQPDRATAAELRTKYSELSDSLSELGSRSDEIKRKLTKIASMTECPSCLQDISCDHKQKISLRFSEESSQLSDELEKNTPKLSALSEALEELEKQERYYSVTKDKFTQQRKLLEQSLAEKAKQKGRIEEDSGDLDAEKEKMKQIAKEALQFISRKNELSEEKQLQEISQVLLKDNGIKTAIIKEYLPVLNKLINKYLMMFDFFVNFNLDESFNEVIKSRGRDEFSYSSFSEGEKAKINISILFAFRQVAAMKNSARTNLLIMDEAFDSSLDLESVDALSVMLTEFSSSNLFVVSHRGIEHFDKFERIIEVKKKGDFSSIEYAK